jgi:hypothetical protein
LYAHFGNLKETDWEINGSKINKSGLQQQRKEKQLFFAILLTFLYLRQGHNITIPVNKSNGHKVKPALKKSSSYS